MSYGKVYDEAFKNGSETYRATNRWVIRGYEGEICASGMHGDVFIVGVDDVMGVTLRIKGVE